MRFIDLVKEIIVIQKKNEQIKTDNKKMEEMKKLERSVEVKQKKRKKNNGVIIQIIMDKVDLSILKQVTNNMEEGHIKH